YINSAGNISLTGSVPTTLSSNGMYINSTGIGTNTLGNITFDPKTGNLQINANSGILTLDAVSSTLANTTNIDISSNTSTIQNSDLNASGYVNLISNTGTTSINNSNMSAAGNFNVTGNTGISLTGSGNTLSGGMVKFLSSNGDIGITGYNITGSIGLFTNSTGNINLTNSDLNYGDDLYLYGSDFTFTNSLLTNATATGKIFAAFDSLTLVSPRNILAGNNIYFGNINNLLVTQNNILSDKFKELNLANPLSGSTIDLAGATVSSNSGSMYIKSTGNLLSSNSALSTLSANGIFINSTGAGTNTLGNITFNPKAGSLQINADSGTLTLDTVSSTAANTGSIDISSNILNILSSGLDTSGNFNITSNTGASIVQDSNLSATGNISLSSAGVATIQDSTIAATGNNTITATGITLTSNTISGAILKLLASSGDISATNSTISASNLLGLYAQSGNITAADSALTSTNNSYIFGNVHTFTNSTLNAGKVYSAFNTLTLDNLSYINATSSDMYLGKIASATVSEVDALATEFKNLLNNSTYTGNTINLAGGTPINASAGNVYINSSGNLFINAASPTTLTARNINIDAGGTADIKDTNLSANTTSGIIDIDSPGNLSIYGTSPTFTAHDIYLDSNAQTSLTNATLNASTIGLSGDTGLTLNAGTNLTATDLGLGSLNGNILVSPSTVFAIGNNLYTYSNILTVDTVNLAATGNIYSAFNNLTLLNSGSLTATNGDINFAALPIGTESILTKFVDSSSFETKFGNITTLPSTTTVLNLTGSTPLTASSGNVNVINDNVIFNIADIATLSNLDVDAVNSLSISSSNNLTLDGASAPSLTSGNIYLDSSGLLTLGNITVSSGNIGISGNTGVTINAGSNIAATNNLGLGSSSGNITINPSSTFSIGSNLYTYSNRLTLDSVTLNTSGNIYSVFSNLTLAGTGELRAPGNIKLGGLPNDSNSISTVFNAGSPFVTKFGALYNRTGDMAINLAGGSYINSTAGTVSINTTSGDLTMLGTTGGTPANILGTGIYINSTGTGTNTLQNITFNPNTGSLQINADSG
ncbi:MAG: hypothetical protein ACD_20C00405G0001, partial [uncultured bacterium]